ncbi:MAG: coproporphyrinogen dehydrogenase, partial [Bellilinea sp.]
GAFDSLNIDLIFNFPGQDEAVIERDIQMALASNANQLTYYPLMTSPSVRQQLKKTIGDVTFDREAAFYEQIVSRLSPHFDLSTAWTFSRKGRSLIDEYIVKSEEYVGVGSGSFSYLNGSLYVNTFSLNFYQQWVSGGTAPIAGKRRFSRMDQMRYRFMMDLFGLRLDKKQWQADFGAPVERCLPLEMLAFEKVGAFQTNNGKEITLTPRGRYLLVTLMREFFSSINRVRDQARRVVLASEPQVSPETRLSDAQA